MPVQTPSDEPPVISWGGWWIRQRQNAKQGAHVLFCGPTQSGKTLLCRFTSRLRSYVVVFGTKAVDPSLDEYVAEGYARIDHWPPTRDDYRRGGWKWKGSEARFILWPKIVKRSDLRAYRSQYKKCLEDVFIKGGWTVVIDESLWVSGRAGLNLGTELGDVAYGSASNNVTMHLLAQRPANIPPVAWTSCSQALIFHSGRTDDVGELASLGTYEPKDAKIAVRRLRGHQFLDLPCRGGYEWSVSEIELEPRASGLYVPAGQGAVR